MTMPMANAKKKTFAEKADKRRAKDVKASTTSSSPIGSLKTLPYCVSYSVATLNAKLQMTFPKYTHLNLWRHYLPHACTYITVTFLFHKHFVAQQNVDARRKCNRSKKKRTPSSKCFDAKLL
jgi:hypothetical protein